MTQAVGRTALGVVTLGASELLPSSVKKSLATGVGTGLTLGVSQAVDAYGRAVKPPAPPGSPPPVTTATKPVQEAVADAARRRANARGFTSTILQSFLQGSGRAEGLKPTLGS